MRILVVDDDRSVRDALRRALTLGGYEVESAEGGQQGLTQVATAAPGLSARPPAPGRTGWPPWQP